MNKKAYTKPCIKEVLVLTEPISFDISSTDTASGGGDSKKYSDEGAAGGLGIWESMNGEEKADEEEQD